MWDITDRDDDAEPRDDAAPLRAEVARPALRADETLFEMECGADGAALRIGLPSEAGSPAVDDAKAVPERAIMERRAMPVKNDRRYLTMGFIMRVSFRIQ